MSDKQIGMSEQQLLHLFTQTLRDVLADDEIELEMTTRRTDIPNWDSFSYINFVAAIEMELHVRFAIADVESFDNVGAIVRRTQSLRSSAS